MKKLSSLFKTSAIIYFAGIASFLSKAMGNSLGFGHSMPGMYHQTKYGVPSPSLVYPGESSSFLSLIVKYLEGALVIVIFLVGVINYLKIRKIEDKELKAKKVKNAIITIIILLVIGILIGLGYRFYNKYYG